MYSTASRTRMAAMIGRIRCKPSAPRGIKIVSAASGPYAEDPRPSKPIAGTPSSAVILRALPSRFASLRPISIPQRSTSAPLRLMPSLGKQARSGGVPADSLEIEGAATTSRCDAIGDPDDDHAEARFVGQPDGDGRVRVRRIHGPGPAGAGGAVRADGVCRGGATPLQERHAL